MMMELSARSCRSFDPNTPPPSYRALPRPCPRDMPSNATSFGPFKDDLRHTRDWYSALEERCELCQPRTSWVMSRCILTKNAAFRAFRPFVGPLAFFGPRATVLRHTHSENIGGPGSVAHSKRASNAKHCRNREERRPLPRCDFNSYSAVDNSTLQPPHFL